MSENKENLSLRINQVKEKYFFSANETVTSKISALSDLFFRDTMVETDFVLFLASSADRKQKEVIITDKDYNFINRFDLSRHYPWNMFCFQKYNGDFFVGGAVSVSASKVMRNVKIFSADFSLICTLEERYPYFAGKPILSFAKDDIGGMYFCEDMTGITHYLDKNGVVSSFQGEFTSPYQIVYAKGKLYIADLFKTLNLKTGRNISVFAGNKFQQTELTGESIGYSAQTDSFYVSSGYIEKCIRKYDAQCNLLFTKDFEFNDNKYRPVIIAVNKNNLLLYARNQRYPIVYDIY